MSETPISPESGAASGGTAPEDGNPGSLLQPPAGDSPEPEPLAAETPAADAAAAVVPKEPAPLPESAVADDGSTAPAAAAAPLEPSVAPAAPSSPPAAAEPAVQPPGVAATIAVPPLEETEGGGGEWELLVERFTTWWNSGELNRQWQRIRGPLKGVAILVAVLLALQVYATVVSTVDAIPVVSGLLELTGLIAVLQFSATRLLRSSDRQEVLAQLQRRWLDFRGRS